MRFGCSIPSLTAVPRSSENYAGATRVRYERTYKLCRMAEDLGYDFGTIGQHRFSADVIDASQPLVVLATLAQHTRKLRLCTNIALLATHPPIDSAEIAATVDELSEGRLIVGLGLGYPPYCGIDRFPALSCDSVAFEPVEELGWRSSAKRVHSIVGTEHRTLATRRHCCLELPEYPNTPIPSQHRLES
jgi:hypothetical protein